MADVFDALTTHRPYKIAWSHEDAMNELLSLRGTASDPAAVDAFGRLFHEGAVARIQQQLPTPDGSRATAII